MSWGRLIAFLTVIVLIVNVVFLVQNELSDSCKHDNGALNDLLKLDDNTADYVVSAVGALFVAIMVGMVSPQSLSWLPGANEVPKVQLLR